MEMQRTTEFTYLLNDGEQSSLSNLKAPIIFL